MLRALSAVSGVVSRAVYNVCVGNLRVTSVTRDGITYKIEAVSQEVFNRRAADNFNSEIAAIAARRVIEKGSQRV